MYAKLSRPNNSVCWAAVTFDHKKILLASCLYFGWYLCQIWYSSVQGILKMGQMDNLREECLAVVNINKKTQAKVSTQIHNLHLSFSKVWGWNNSGSLVGCPVSLHRINGFGKILIFWLNLTHVWCKACGNCHRMEMLPKPFEGVNLNWLSLNSVILTTILKQNWFKIYIPTKNKLWTTLSTFEQI